MTSTLVLTPRGRRVAALLRGVVILLILVGSVGLILLGDAIGRARHCAAAEAAGISSASCAGVK